MKHLNYLHLLATIPLILLLSCSKKDSGLQGESWPKEGYLFTTNDLNDSVYVESGNFAVTSLYSPSFPLTDPEKKWKMSLPASGDGIVIHNTDNDYWSIDSTFHPGLMVEQHFVDIRTITNTSNISDFNRFRYHKSGDGKTFYLESVRFPGAYVTGLGHAESGRGLRLRNQSSGLWKFWLQQQ